VLLAFEQPIESAAEVPLPLPLPVPVALPILVLLSFVLMN
jgi:hypothetical protein